MKPAKPEPIKPVDPEPDTKAKEPEKPFQPEKKRNVSVKRKLLTLWAKLKWE